MDYEIVEYKEKNIKLDVYVSPYDNTIWLSQEQMTILFKRSQSTISYHIKETIKSNGLIDGTYIEIFDNSNKYKPIKFYNLETIIAVSYRVKSQRGLTFKKWAEDSLNNLRNKKNINYEIVRFNRDNLILDVKVFPSEDTV